MMKPAQENILIYRPDMTFLHEIAVRDAEVSVFAENYCVECPEAANCIKFMGLDHCPMERESLLGTLVPLCTVTFDTTENYRVAV